MWPTKNSYEHGSNVGNGSYQDLPQGSGSFIDQQRSSNRTQSPSPFADFLSQQLLHYTNAIDMQHDGTNDDGANHDPELGPSEAASSQSQIPPGRQQIHTPYNAPPTSATPTMTQEASELKARLKAKLAISKRVRASSQPLTVQTQKTSEGTSSLRASPLTPNLSTLEDMISAASKASEDVPDEMNTEEPNKSPNLRNANTEPAIRANIIGAGDKIGNGSTPSASSSNSKFGSKHASNGSVSDGEIVEDVPVPQPKINRPNESIKQSESKPAKGGQATHKPREESISHGPDTRESQPLRREAKVDTKIERNRDDRREDERLVSRQELKPAGRRITSYNDDPRAHPSTEAPIPHHREARDQAVESYRRTLKPEEHVRRVTAPIPIRKAPEPTLVQLLPHDDDLREWLEITGYHNGPYRSKILERRRKLAKLDAEKAQLLAEMEQEERGVPANVAPNTAVPPAPIMAPPPVPGKVGLLARPEVESSEQRLRVNSSTKRSYSEVQDDRDNSSTFKAMRMDDRGSRLKKEEDEERLCVRPLGSDPYKSEVDHHDDRSYFDEARISQRSSRERDASPSSGMRAYESRPPARRYEEDFSDDWKQSSKDTRPFEVIGGYRGRAYDPNFRGRSKASSSSRGRGESRADFQHRDDFRDRDFDNRDYSPHREFQGRGSGRGGFRGDFQGRGGSREGDFAPHTDREGTLGTRLANSLPTKDPRGYSKGGKGETRYFIIKSFNEENVIRCIEDSIWTTQVQNGDVLKRAFETCKNVILIFSINKSRAFQGYARMESLPGSVPRPSWQNAIQWETAGAFRVRWLVVCSTLFRRVGHLKNSFNDNQAVLIGKDGQEIDEHCAEALVRLIDEEYEVSVKAWRSGDGDRNRDWDWNLDRDDYGYGHGDGDGNSNGDRDRL